MEYKREIKLSQEAVDLIRSTAFFSSSINFETGEVKENKKDQIRAMILCNFIASSKNGGYISASTIRDIKSENYEDIIKTLISIGIIDRTEKLCQRKARQYIIIPKYNGSTIVKFSKSEINLIDSIYKKPYTRGKLAITDKDVRINLDYSTFYRLMISENKTVETIDEQWKSIYEINCGRLNAKQKRNRRLYSNLTGISKVVHPYITIDGKEVIELDGHATYFTILPNILKNIYSGLNEKTYKDELKDLESFITNTKNIYEIISSEQNITKKEAKDNTVSWICDPSCHFSGIKKEIDNWFGTRWPTLQRKINDKREYKTISYLAMDIESDIYVTAAKILKKKKIDCVTKHDAILCHEKDEKIVYETLSNLMIKHDVINKIKTTKYSSLCPSDTLLRKDQDENKEFLKGTNQKSHIKEEGEEGKTTLPVFGVLKVQKQTRNRKTEIKQNKDGRWRSSVKGTKHMSRKGETKEEFAKRIGVTI